MDNSIRQLVIPSPVEAFLWFLLGLAVLLIANIGKMWNYLSGMPASVVVEHSSLLGTASAWFLNVEAKIDPRVVDFLVWVLVGILAVGSVMMFQGWLQAAGKELTLLEYMRSPMGRWHETHALVLRVGLRILGIAGLVFMLWLYLGALAPALDRLFFTSVANLSDWQSWVWLVVTPAVTGAYLYVMTIFVRLILLRTNNF